MKKIITDNHWKPFKYRNEVPAKILREQFGYQNSEDVVDGFIHYRKRWYHLSEFMLVTDNSPFEGWHGYKRTPFFFGRCHPCLERRRNVSDWHVLPLKGEKFFGARSES